MDIRILYPIINGEISGGNMIALRIIEESLKIGYGVVVNSPNEGKFTQILREKGIKVCNINTCNTYRIDSIFRLASLIRKERINLVHSHVTLGGIIICRCAGALARVPVINHAHGTDFLNLNSVVRACQFFLNWVTSKFFCDQVIAVSQFVKDGIIKQGVDANKIIVIYNGVSLKESQYQNSAVNIRNELGVRVNQSVVGEVGRICDDKGQHILIKAAALVVRKFPDTSFVIVGEVLTKGDGYRKELERLVRDLGLQDRVVFTGYRSDIMELMNAFDLFVLPSTYMEGLAVVILEAMAAKKAVVTTIIGGNPEIVMDGNTGTLVPANDPDKLAEAIIYHLSNLEISKQMGKNGYELVKQCFSLAQMLDETMSVYHKVVRAE